MLLASLVERVVLACHSRACSERVVMIVIGANVLGIVCVERERWHMNSIVDARAMSPRSVDRLVVHRSQLFAA